jgi:hypothetical protein
MTKIDPTYSSRHLGNRPIPNDLRLLLEMHLNDSVPTDCLNGIRFLDGDRSATLIEMECSGRNDLSGVSKLAHAQAMADMVHMSGFVAEDGDDSAIGYWFGSAQSQIDDAPLILFNRNHSFSVLPGAGIAETVLVLASHGDDRIFVKVRNLFRRFGLQVAPTSLQGVAIRSCSPSPQTIYEQLIATYSADLSTATPRYPGHQRDDATFLSRRAWTRTSRTKPSWSTARESQCFLPAMVMTTSSRCHLSPRRGSPRRMRLANSRPNFRPHCRMVS